MPIVSRRQGCAPSSPPPRAASTCVSSALCLAVSAGREIGLHRRTRQGAGTRESRDFAFIMQVYEASIQYSLVRIGHDERSLAGNYESAPGKLSGQEWEMPLIFRIGASVTPVLTDMHEIVLSVDALHPNNNSESVNVGAQYSLTFPSFGKLFLRGGYKGLFMEDSQYGVSYGLGLQIDMMSNQSIKVEYACRSIGILGNVQSIGVSLLF